MNSTQHCALLDALLGRLDQNPHIKVLHIGPALPETVDFFSDYRCRLHFVDLFSELPLAADRDEDGETASDQFKRTGEKLSQLLKFPTGTRFDLCLFWDILNYLPDASITAFMQILQPYLHNTTVAHVLAVHNIYAPAVNCSYGIVTADTLLARPRAHALPGYAPHSQRQLQHLLSCFNFERSVLRADGRLELILQHNSANLVRPSSDPS